MQFVCDQDDFPPEFADDIAIAICTIMILAPFLALNAIERMLPHLKKAIERGVRVCIFIQKPYGWDNRRSLSDVQLAKLQQFETGLRLLESIGAHVTLRERVHVKVAVVDLAIKWYGSLNMMSFNPNLTDDEMTREENVFEACAVVGRQKLDSCPICIDQRRKVRRKDFVVDAESAGRIIANARKANGLSQEDLAQKCALHSTTVNRIETGKQIPQLDSYVQMAQSCGLSVAVLPDYALPFLEKFLETVTYAFPEAELPIGLSTAAQAKIAPDTQL